MSALAPIWLSSACVTSKTAAIHVRWQHTMCNFQGPRLQPGTRKAFFLDISFLMPTGVYMQESHTPFTTHHLMHLPTKTSAPSIYMPCTFQQPSLVPIKTIFSGMRQQCTFHLHIYAMHTLQGDTYMMLKSCKKYVENKYNSLPRHLWECCSSLTSPVVLPR